MEDGRTIFEARIRYVGARLEKLCKKVFITEIQSCVLYILYFKKVIQNYL
jgi:hypothetical protein